MTNKSPAHRMKSFQNTVGMTVTLVSFGMLFATMYLGYMLARFNSPTWPPVEIENLPMFIPLMSTLVIGLSSLSYRQVEKSVKWRKLFWFVTFALGVGFLVLQNNLWKTLQESGILASNGNIPSMIYAFTWVHAAHIALALLLLLWLGFILTFKPAKATEETLLNVGKFWHFLGIVWFVMYLTLFVL